MGLRQDVEGEVDAIIAQPWDVRDGQVVPETTDVALAGGAVKLHAVMLYADLADSTELVLEQDWRVAAKVIKCFLGAASRVIRAFGGEIRSFDGDRVMGIFIGDSKNTNAAKTALKINGAFQDIVKPKLEAKYPSLIRGSYRLAHCTGVDRSDVRAVRGGIRNNNDLVWVGRAPNVAAKLSNIRSSPYYSFITADVFNTLADEAKISQDGKVMWEPCSWKGVSGIDVIYRSAWRWSL